jgi:enediyne biosynthesis protein E4
MPKQWPVESCQTRSWPVEGVLSRGGSPPAGEDRRTPALVAAGLLALGAAAAPGCAMDEAQPAIESASAALSSGDRSALVADVLQLAAIHEVTPIPPAPPVRDELFELGRSLAFDKILSGNENISCMTCHDPRAPMHTGDGRHLALGEGGIGVGPDRIAGGIVPRNSTPLFNLHALDAMFWDLRVELAPNEGDGGLAQLRTPARNELTPEMKSVFEFGVASAQAMFPVVSRVEMRGQQFTNAPNDNEVADDLDFQGIWSSLMARLGEIPQYVAMFEAAYPGTAFEDMTFAHAANAIAGFEIRAFEARGSDFQRFLEGEVDALSDSALRGARDFFEAGCATCHSGPMLTDERAHNTGLAQFGPGKGDGPFNNDDFGRAGDRVPFELGRIPGGPDTPNPHCNNDQNPHDLYAFRTAPLHNVALTGPWGHAGQFSDLRDFVAHYGDPEDALRNYDMEAQIHPSEWALLNTRVDNVEAILSCLSPYTQVTIPDMDDMIAFLESLTDPGSLDLAWTIPDSVPSGLPVDDGVAPEIGGETQGTVTFANIASDPASGLADYRRVPSEREAIAEALRMASLEEPQIFPVAFDTPLRPRGMPGIAVFDYNGNGALDVFVSNGPGAPNSLFENQLPITGELRFVDRAVEAGVAAVETDSSGVCFGDVNNNGFPDLYVVADKGRSHFFLNNCDGTFTDISDESGATPDGTGGTSCAFGDINGDGLLDLFVGRAWHQEDRHACFLDPFGAGIQHNELYLNNGDGTFEDVSETSGIRHVGGLPPWAEGAPTITWSVAMVDYNQNGFIDIIHADDQCAFPNAELGGIDRGYVQIFENDGTGNFINRTVEAGTNQPSAWMGLSFGDFNSSGNLDVFSSSFGDWGEPFAGAPAIIGYQNSRWFLNQGDGTFDDPGVGEMKHTPFGWGTSARDFDNDGATDIVFHGGMEMVFIIDASNPGTLLLGDGEGNFRLDRGAFETNHTYRNNSGVAVGDLNGNGFPDIVTVSNYDIPPELPVHRYGSVDREAFYFSTFDATAYFFEVYEHITPSEPDLLFRLFPWYKPTFKGDRLFQYNENVTFPNGTLTVELNSANNGNHWAAVELVGAVGLIPEGRVNRSAIGSTIAFTPEGGRSVLAPVLGGSSHLSQDSLIQNFGLGQAARGTADILWPGGTRNRLYDVEHGERLRIPELPCSYDTSDDLAAYTACVDGALAGLSDAGLVDNDLRVRMRASALLAYHESR